MIVDDGVVRYDLHRHERGAPAGTVSLLPPHIAHTGRAGTRTGSASGCSTSTPTSWTRRCPGGPSTSRRSPTTCCASAGPAAPGPGRAGRRAEAESRLAPHRPTGSPDGSAAPRRPVRRAGRRAPRPARQPARRRGSRCARPARCCMPTPRTWCAASAGSSACRRTATSSAAGWRRRAAGCSTANRSPTSRQPSASTTSPTCIGTSPGSSGRPRGGSPPARERYGDGRSTTRFSAALTRAASSTSRVCTACSAGTGKSPSPRSAAANWV